MTKRPLTALILTILLPLAGCQPITHSDPPTGNYVGPLIGGAVGAALPGLFGASKTYMWAGGLAGAGLGYYFTSLRFDASGIIHAGGHVFTQGQMAMIEVPTDHLFEVNTTEFLPGTDPILDSMVSVLSRYPGNNILISASTSGSGPKRYEQELSEERARQIAGYLWAHGVIGSTEQNVGSMRFDKKRYVYVGYGAMFPIANDIRLKGIRQNSRIQITAYPTDAQLKVNGCYSVFTNIGGNNEKHCRKDAPLEKIAPAFAGDHTPDAATDLSNPGNINTEVTGPTPSTTVNPSLEEQALDGTD